MPDLLLIYQIEGKEIYQLDAQMIYKSICNRSL